MNITLNKILYFLFISFLFFDNINCAAKCYYCRGSECVLSEQVCRNSFSFCQYITTTTGGVSVIEKGCATSCQDGLTKSFGPTSIVYRCCSSDLCNSAQSFLGFQSIQKIIALISTGFIFKWLFL
ncbi:unnamed protein product [Brachionus calyciflorus]|uniref:Snake toxin/toxin-like domain-containing protein n=1 Tax=Brachionus calyciflorus TaxID=104777 RepID=A0A813YVA6_9BILA|nr:unnamed protein product [Brachionus calyciflorus]